MSKHKTKYIFRCNAPTELTRFNKEYNKTIEEHCDRIDVFRPSLLCLNHTDGKACKYLQWKAYEGDK